MTKHTFTRGSELLIGAHASTQGGIFNALYEGQNLGATTVQLFTSNQRQWKGRPVTADVLAKWDEALSETGLRQIMSHGSYLINLGSPDPENLEKSRRAFREEIERCLTFGISFLNFHPGSHLKDSSEACLDRIADSLLEMAPLLQDKPLRLLLESTAGQGSNLGYRFEELAYIIDRVDGELPVGVCIDTCHSFAAGYDIRTAAGWENVLQEFDQTVGIEKLYAFHLNDSKCPLGSRKDRHADLGKGEIGIDCFRFLMQDPRTRDLPKYLETPGRLEIWDKEIAMLREFADEKI